MDAVRPDHDIGRVGCPVGEVHHGLSGILTKPRTAVSGTYRARRQLLHEQGEQIGAANADVRSRAGELMWPVAGGPLFIHYDFGRHVPRAFVFSSRRRHTRYWRDWSADVCSSD